MVVVVFTFRRGVFNSHVANLFARTRTLDKKLQVFLSSTHIDLKAERQEAVEAILHAGHVPAGMELFAAGDESQLAIIRRWIDESNVFMLILGGRYGSIEPKSGKSYVELEYDFAVEKGKPLFAVVIRDECLEAKVKRHGREVIETINGHLLRAFREKVTEKMCRFFGDCKDIKLAVHESLGNFERIESLSGWIRWSDVAVPKTAPKDIALLKVENARLAQKVAELEQAHDFRRILSELSTADMLSDSAKRMLLAAKSGDGRIIYLRFVGGATMTGGNTQLIESSDPREEALWKDALDRLVRYGLVEPTGLGSETFRLTNRGYLVADEIEARPKKPHTESEDVVRTLVDQR